MRQRAITWVIMLLMVVGMAVSFTAHADESVPQLVVAGGVSEKSSSFFDFIPKVIVNFVNTAVETFKGAVNYMVTIVTPTPTVMPQVIATSAETKPPATYVPPMAMPTPLSAQMPVVAVAPEVTPAAPSMLATTAAAALAATTTIPQDQPAPVAPPVVTPKVIQPQVATNKVITIQKGPSATVAPQVPSASASATVAAALNSVVPVAPSGAAAAPVAPSAPTDALGLKNVAGAPDATTPTPVTAVKPVAPSAPAAPAAPSAPIMASSSGPVTPAASPSRPTSSPAPAPVQASSVSAAAIQAAAFQPMALASTPVLAAPVATVASSPAPAPVRTAAPVTVATAAPSPIPTPVAARPVAATVPTSVATTATRPITTTTTSPTRVATTIPLTAPIIVPQLLPIDRIAAAALPPPPPAAPSPRCADVTYAMANRVACNCPVREIGLGSVQPTSDGQRHAVTVDAVAGKVMVDVKLFMQDALGCAAEIIASTSGSFILPSRDPASNVYVTPEGRIFALGTSAADPHTLSILSWTVGGIADNTISTSIPLPEFLQIPQPVRGLLISKNATTGGTSIDIAFGLNIAHCELARDDSLTCTPLPR